MSINSSPETIGEPKENPALVDTQVNQPAGEQPILNGISIFEPRHRSMEQELAELRQLRIQLLAQAGARP